MFCHHRTLTSTLFHPVRIWSGGILILALSNILSAHATITSTSTLYSQELIQQLGIRQQDLVNLEQGNTVSFAIDENNEKELAAGVAIFLAAPPTRVLEFIENRGMASVDTEVTSHTFIPLQATLDTFKGFSFTNQNNEERNFLKAEAGDQFNLSSQELQMLQVINPTQADSASLAYGKILMQRWKTYREEGLKGIAPYDRGSGKTANPGEELLNAAMTNKVLARHFPELYIPWLNYPANLPNGTTERFFLINRHVESRPTAVLVHRVMLTTEKGGISLSRQFYVGHSYNSSQLTIGCLPYRNGSLVFYLNQTFTDQITGFGSSVKRSIGREQMRRRMDRHLKNLSNAIQ